MKYLKVIAVCFLIGLFIDVTVVFILQSGNEQLETDMKYLPYALGLGFNLFLAICTLPVYLNAMHWVRRSIVAHIASFFLLPVIFTAYATFIDTTERMTIFAFCAPYLVVLLFFFFRLRHQRMIEAH